MPAPSRSRRIRRAAGRHSAGDPLRGSVRSSCDRYPRSSAADDARNRAGLRARVRTCSTQMDTRCRASRESSRSWCPCAASTAALRPGQPAGRTWHRAHADRLPPDAPRRTRSLPERETVDRSRRLHGTASAAACTTSASACGLSVWRSRHRPATDAWDIARAAPCAPRGTSAPRSFASPAWSAPAARLARAAPAARAYRWTDAWSVCQAKQLLELHLCRDRSVFVILDAMRPAARHRQALGCMPFERLP